MAIESMVALGLATAFLVGLAIYANRHREEDKLLTRTSRILTVAGRRLTIEVVAEGDAFVARCRDVEVASDGPTEQEAVENLREALELYFERDETRL